MSVREPKSTHDRSPWPQCAHLAGSAAAAEADDDEDDDEEKEEEEE